MPAGHKIGDLDSEGRPDERKRRAGGGERRERAGEVDAGVRVGWGRKRRRKGREWGEREEKEERGERRIQPREK